MKPDRSGAAGVFLNERCTLKLLFLVIIILLVAVLFFQIGWLSNRSNAVAMKMQPLIRMDAQKTNIELSQDSFIKNRFQERSELRKKVCSRPSYSKMRNNLSRSTTSFARDRIVWCRMAKVGTTYVYHYLEKTVIKTLHKPGRYSGKKKKMIFVREPYSRLMSAYINKILINPKWQRDYGANIIKKFRPKASKKALKCGNDVTFSEFLKYVILVDKTGWKWNAHFVPMKRLCSPCAPYDYIGHLETLKDDLTFILNSVNISVDMDFQQSGDYMKTSGRQIISGKEEILPCETLCSALIKLWWSYQSRGLISSSIQFPFKGEQCNTSEKVFGDFALNAYLQSNGIFDKDKQRRDFMVALYLQVSLSDRLKIKKILKEDCEVYGYDPQPDDIFPELKKNSIR